MKYLRFYIIIFLFFLYNYHCICQENDFPIDSLELYPSYGIVGGYNFNIHSSDFSNLPGVPSCCPEFTNGTGSGFYLGASIDYPLNYLMQLTLRATYSQSNGKLTSTDTTTIILDGKNSTGEFEHLLDAKFGTFGLEPLFTYKLKPDLALHGGFRIGFLTNSYYYQEEKITKPADRGTFIDGRSKRNQSEGKIEEASAMQAGLKLGASYKLPLNKEKTLFLVPELFYTYNFTNLVKDRDWKYHQLSLGVSIKYRTPPPPPPPPAPPIAPPDPLLSGVQKPPLFAIDVDAVQVDSSQNESKDFTLKIEDFVSYNMRPLLTYIFFDDNSAEIPPRYILLSKEETASFSFDKLRNYNALETYYYVLNIIGKRLQDNPNVKITLIGTNCNQGSEKNNKELSQARAQAVANYFQNIWGISPNRMTIESRNLPKEPSRSDDPQGVAENRRVEIYSDDPSIIEPVFTVDTMRVISALAIKFIPKVLTEVGVYSWDLNVMQGAQSVFNKNGKGQPPTSIDWEISQRTVPKGNEDLAYSINGIDSVGQLANSKTKRIPITKTSIEMKRRSGQSDTEYEYYSLILFDFAKSDLNKEHRKVVDFVKSRITDESKVTIYGFTDNIGEENINKKISEKRARAVLKRLNIDNNVVVEGKGESELIYDNSTPEGRFYCRTVTINIETPIKQ